MKDGLALIQSLESRRCALMVSGDMGELDKLLSESLLYGHSNGTLDDKGSFLALLQSGKLRYLAVTPVLDRAIAIADDAIAATGFLDTHAAIGDVEKKLRGRYLVVWRQSATGWQLHALQGSSSG